MRDNLPVVAPALKSRLTLPMAWTPQVTNLPAWRAAGRAKLWELSLQMPDSTPFAPRVVAEIDRVSYGARKVLFNLTADSRQPTADSRQPGAGCWAYCWCRREKVHFPPP